MHRTYRMMKTSVGSSWENQTQQSRLRNPSQSLETAMFHDIKNNFIRDFYKSMNGIIDDFQFISHKKILSCKIMKKNFNQTLTFRWYNFNIFSPYF